MNKTELLTLFCDFSFLEDKESAAGKSFYKVL